MLPPPKLFTYLEAVARAGSIRKAAARLNVASTALNRMVLDAERDVGTPLFERLPRGVRLTAAGEVLIAAIRRSLADLAASASHIEQLRGLVRGTVRIACAETVAHDMVPTLIGRYQNEHRGVQFVVESGATPELVSALLADRSDLLIAHDPPPNPALAELASAPQTLCALVRPDHPLASHGKLRLADCQPYSVALGLQSFASRRLIDQLAAKLNLTFRVAIEAGSVQTLLAFARETGAICFQFASGTRRDVASGELVALPLTDRDLVKSRLVLATRRGRSLPIASLSIIEIVRQALQQAPEM